MRRLYLRLRERLFRVPDHDPLISARNPWAIFLLGLSILSSLPLLSGDAGSAVLERSLPNWVVVTWGWCLLGGSLVALSGHLWPRERNRLRTPRLTALTMERAGMIVVGTAVFLYAYVVARSVESFNDVRFAVTIQAGYGAMCFWRVVQITVKLRWRRLRDRAR